MRFFRKTAGRGSPRALSSARPFLEALETRLAPYAATGNAWPEPQLVTISFVPDGTLMTSGPNGNVYSDLFAKFNAKWSTQTWQNAIISAAETWAQYANVNFAVVADNGTPLGQGNYQQADPGMGDIRIGGYNIGSNYLGMTYMPPPQNNYSAAGDLTFNDAQPFNVGKTYDLQTVALHEFGHALGLDHSTGNGTGPVMYPTYSGLKKGLSADDIAGIQAIYGARQPDANNLGTPNNSFITATDLSSQIAPASQSSGGLLGTVGTVANNLLGGPVNQSVQVSANDLTTVGATQYYTFTVPANAPSNFTVYVQSAGLSLLRPQVTVYAADQATVLGSASGTGSYGGANLSVAVNGVTPGTQYYVAVSGADATAFGAGNYNLTVNFGSGAAPVVTSPVTPLLNGAVLSAGGGLALQAIEAAPPDFLEIDPSFTDGVDGGPVAPPANGADAGQPPAAAPSAAPVDRAADFIGQAYQYLLGRSADPVGMGAFTNVFFQAEVNALQGILKDPQFGPQVLMLLQQPGGVQAVQDLLSGFGEAAVVQGIEASPEFQAHVNAITALDQLMIDAATRLEQGPGHQGPAASAPASAGD
jgi:hypothetical protein